MIPVRWLDALFEPPDNNFNNLDIGPPFGAIVKIFYLVSKGAHSYDHVMEDRSGHPAIVAFFMSFPVSLCEGHLPEMILSLQKQTVS